MSGENGIEWTTEKRKLGDLLPWEPNPRHSTKAQARRIEESLEEFGYSQLVEIDPDNVIIDGHQRHPVLLKLLQEFGPDAEIECRVASRALTTNERKKYIALKHKGAVGEWDVEAVLDLYEGGELISFGFEKDELLAFGFDFGDDDIELPNSPQQMEELEAERIVTIHTTQDALESFESLLLEISEYEGTQVNIS